MSTSTNSSVTDSTTFWNGKRVIVTGGGRVFGLFRRRKTICARGR